MDTQVPTPPNEVASSSTPRSSYPLGARLKAAREALHLTEKEAAVRLNLSQHFITMMEQESFSNGPPATFMRGYVRSYARLLQFSDAEIQQALAALEPLMPKAPTASAPPILNTSPMPHYDYIRWMTYGVPLILAALVAIWWSNHPRDNATVTAQTTPSTQTTQTTSATLTTTPPAPSTSTSIIQLSAPLPAPGVPILTK